MPGQYRKLVGYSVKYPYLVGIRTESAGLGTGILISPRLVLTCHHVLCGSTSVKVVSQEGSTSARPVKIDEFLDLALLELEQPILAANVNFSDSPLRPGVVLLAVGVQSIPGKPHELSVAEIELQYLNQNDADGNILDTAVDRSLCKKAGLCFVLVSFVVVALGHTQPMLLDWGRYGRSWRNTSPAPVCRKASWALRRKVIASFLEIAVHEAGL